MSMTKIKGLRIYFSLFNMKIENSYQIKSKEKMIPILEAAIKKNSEYYTDRSMTSLVREWRVHNRLYKMHIMRKKTKDCDFETSLGLIHYLFYYTFGFSFKEDIWKAHKKKILKRKILKKEEQYNEYLDNHRKNIERAYTEIIECPFFHQLDFENLEEDLWVRLKLHDLSKYGKKEYDAYRKNFFPINEKEKEENKADFKKALEHHWQNNPHHWQCRQNKENFSKKNLHDVLDTIENVCDWLAMGYEFHNRPYQYYEKNKDKIILNEKERQFLEEIIYEVDEIYVRTERTYIKSDRGELEWRK